MCVVQLAEIDQKFCSALIHSEAVLYLRAPTLNANCLGLTCRTDLVQICHFLLNLKSNARDQEDKVIDRKK